MKIARHLISRMTKERFHLEKLRNYADTKAEQLILLLTLSPHIKPNYFDSIIQEHFPRGGDFPEFGGVKGTNHRGMLPTGETVQFILAGNDVDKRLEVQKYFSREHFFHKTGILSLEKLKDGEPAMSGRIVMAPEWVEYLLTGDMPGNFIQSGFPGIICWKLKWNGTIW